MCNQDIPINSNVFVYTTNSLHTIGESNFDDPNHTTFDIKIKESSAADEITIMDDIHQEEDTLDNSNNYGEMEWKFKSYFANIGTYIANRKALIGATNNSVNTLYRQYQV